MTAIARECQAMGVRSKTWMPKSGLQQVGVPLRPATVRGILMNAVYAGYITVEGALHRGIHEPIISQELWDRTAELRAIQLAQRARAAPQEVLDGLTYDCFGRGMTVNRLYRQGKLHAYYRSNQNAWGKSNGVKRVTARAAEVETLVIASFQDLLCDREKLRSLMLDLGHFGTSLTLAGRRGPVASRRLVGLSRDQLRSVLHGLIIRIEVSRERLKVVIRAAALVELLDWDTVGLFRSRMDSSAHDPTYLIDIPCAGAIRLERYVRLPIVARKAQTYRINKRLRELIVDARNAWTLIEGNRDLAPSEIARRNGCSLSHLMRLLRLTYLAPDIAMAIMDGAQPSEITRRSLLDANLPLDWALQRKLLGFPEQPPMRTVEKPY